ncbi:MAG: hypothetical protein HEP71_21855 [Roseivirga sp.]|nr:hypothetical protein [Roseivirga sp.]
MFITLFWFRAIRNIDYLIVTPTDTKVLVGKAEWWNLPAVGRLVQHARLYNYLVVEA